MGFYLVIGPHASLVDWPFHYHFSLAENLVSAPRKVSILTRTTAVRVLSTLLGILKDSFTPPFSHNIRDVL